MTDYYVEPDRHGQPTVWVKRPLPLFDVAVIRKGCIPDEYWADIVARMTAPESNRGI